jgi:hypothetical protein
MTLVLFVYVGACFNYLKYIYINIYSNVSYSRKRSILMDIPTINLGQTNVKITRIGLGSMPLSIYGRPTRNDAIKVIHRTIDLGIILIDTADAYCLDENDKNYSELLIHQAIQTYQGLADINKIIVATKGFLNSILLFVIF